MFLFLSSSFLFNTYQMINIIYFLSVHSTDL